MSRSYIVSQLKSMPWLYRLLRKVRMQLGRLRPLKQYPGVYGRIHPNDLMFNKDSPSYYHQVGLGAYNSIEEALSLAGKTVTDIQSLLDFGSGFGRVTRVLAQKIDPTKISAFDVDPEGPTFCASEFGVKPLLFDGNWDSIPFSRYDVIWAGSVFTHLSHAYTKDMLALLSRLLNNDGVLIFTTQGGTTFQKLEKGGYGSDVGKRASTIKSEYEETGFSFVPYGHYKDKNIGMTWSSQPYMDSLVQTISMGKLQLVKFDQRGWLNHQDVHAYRRVENV